MTEKQINKWLRKRFSPLGWTLMIYYGMMNVLVMTAMLRDAVGSILSNPSGGGPDISVLIGNGWGYLMAVAAGFAILYAWKGPDFFTGSLIAKARPMRVGTFLSMIVLCLGAQMANSLWVTGLEAVANYFDRSVLEAMELVSGSSDTVSMFLYVCILGPLSEELLFRGLCLRTLEPFGKRFAILGSAFLFGIFHGNLLQTPYAFLVGLLLGYVTLEYSIIWAAALHIFNNLVLADLMTRLLEILPEGVQNGVNLALYAGGGILAVILLVVRRKDIRSYRAERMDGRCLKCFFGCFGIVALTVLMALSMLLNL